ncbi:MAG: mRNA surveillance protein pelota [Candidatus Micrarchaeia archaeon]
MRIIRFSKEVNSVKLQPDSFDDLYLLARIINSGDVVEGRSFRRFQNDDGEKGEQQEVFLAIEVEKAELDRNGERLRLTGKIVSGKPIELIKLNSYHTLNIGSGSELNIIKKEWRDYLINRLKEAVQDTKKVKLGVVALDDEKASIANIKGYGIEIESEIYSHLSKRMSGKEYEKTRKEYFDSIISIIKNVGAETIIIAGPGFTREDLKKYIESSRIEIGKKLLFVPSSDAERSGIREALQSQEIAKYFSHEKVKREFHLMNLFMQALQVGNAFFGIDGVGESLDTYNAGIVLVNDNLLNEENAQALLDKADSEKVRIEIFNSDDEAGMQLAGFKGIACISKRAFTE